MSPGLNIPTVEFAVANGTLMLAGALTPTEIILPGTPARTWSRVFPCGQVGGARYIKL